MSSPDKLLARIHALQEGVDAAYRQRRSAWETKPAPNSRANHRASIVDKAGGVPVSLWKTRGQPAGVEAT
ncbi:MAG: hypothetical protein WCA12_12580 [Burkholderiales bacterium]